MARNARSRGESKQGADAAGDGLASAGVDAATAGGDGSQDPACKTEGNGRPLRDSEFGEIARNTRHLRLMLETAIPLWAHKARDWPTELRWKCIRDAGEQIAFGGADLMFPSKTRPGKDLAWSEERGYTPLTVPDRGTAPVFNALAKGLGCLLVERPDAVDQVMAALETHAW